MTLARQALILTLGNGLTRGLGFILRLLLARWMGAEALGVMEMANSVGMLALTPVTAGIPAAMSRLTAKQAAIDRPNVLRAGRHLVTRAALWLIPALLLLAPCFAWLLGDMRTLPAILLNAPDILLLGLCSVYCGYCYGLENTLLPAAAECAEQGVRFLLTIALVLSLRGASTGISAALPGAAEAVAALVVVIIFRRAIPLRRHLTAPSRALQKQIFHAVPAVSHRNAHAGGCAAAGVPASFRLEHYRRHRPVRPDDRHGHAPDAHPRGGHQRPVHDHHPRHFPCRG